MKQRALVFLVLSFVVKVLCFPTKLTGKDDDGTPGLSQPYREAITRLGDSRISVSSVTYNTVKRYQCYIESENDAELLLYGFQSWTFPEQDVELTLSYPAENMEAEYQEVEYQEVFQYHLVTGIEVVLLTSGTQTKAYIGSGGLLEKDVSVTFVSESTTVLGYQFWVYGVHEDLLDVGLARSQGNVIC